MLLRRDYEEVGSTLTVLNRRDSIGLALDSRGFAQPVKMEIHLISGYALGPERSEHAG